MAIKDHTDEMHRVMSYCVVIPLKGRKLKPRREWDGKYKSFEFEIKFRSDSDHVICKSTSRIVSRWEIYLEGAPISVKSLMQKMVPLYVAEAKLGAAVSCAHYMLYERRILISLELRVKFLSAS